MRQRTSIPPMLLERRTGHNPDSEADETLNTDEMILRCSSALDHLKTAAIFQSMNGGRPDGVGSDADLMKANVIFDQSAEFYATGLTRELLDEAVSRQVISRDIADRIATHIDESGDTEDHRSTRSRDDRAGH